MDISSGSSYPASSLSNFAPHPFIIDDIECSSMEGFLQSLKFKDENMQREICKKVGRQAKRAGAKKNWQKEQTLYWRGKPYKRDSIEYQKLLDKAFFELSKNSSFKKALLATKNANLTHSIIPNLISCICNQFKLGLLYQEMSISLYNPSRICSICS